ncbi:hypothetical protein [Aeromicrobium sp. UC242_57]|uniref:hypothetical protein n=1 Tax=Aeromicrobium sp. UC242_57 TaxID=3374624 RepID=UPI00379EFA44
MPAQALAVRGAQPLRALTQLALRPPLVPEALSPGRALHDVSDAPRHGAETTWVAAHDLVESVLDAQLPRIVESVLDRIDLNALIAERVDVALIVESVLDQLDLTELSRARIDLAQLATEVIDEIDLPAIIRESTSGVASDVVTGARAVRPAPTRPSHDS